MWRSNRWMTFWGILSVLAMTACGSIDLPSGSGCVPYCVDGAPYVCNAQGQAVAGQACSEGFTCQAGTCAPGSTGGGDCTPVCEPGSCTGDGCGGTCECAGGMVCLSGACVTACMPDCDGKSCGDDGCGGSCGTCESPLFCVDSACSETCDPDCEDKACGDDGCGGRCGECATDEFCVEGACATECTASCGEAVCGDDGCGGSCGECPDGQSCAGGACVLVCSADCDGKSCGDDGCGGSCGECPDAQVCAAGVCADSCTPSCDGKSCGGDGCGGSCGGCAGNESCSEGACICAPACSGKSCGDDGCGGDCGACDVDGGESCDDAGQCTCTPQEQMGCADEVTTAWLDSCGNLGETVLTCPGGMLCQAGECLCVPGHSVDCVPGAPTEVASYDSCGTYEETVAVCGGGQQCQQGACMCVPLGEPACVDGDVWSVDSCGTPLELSEDCAPGAVCEGGACLCLATDEKKCVAGVQGSPCCSPHPGPNCGNAQVQTCVCEQHPECCTGVWNEVCVAAVDELGCGTCAGTWAHQPVAVDSCGTMTPLGECDQYHVCTGSGDCTQNEGFCDNETDSLLLQAQDVFGENESNIGGDCFATWQTLTLMEKCVTDECAGDWDCINQDSNACKEWVSSCQEIGGCADYGACLSECQGAAPCIEACLPGGANGVMGACVGQQYEQELLISAGCAGCFGGYFGCVFGGCYTDCDPESDGCFEDCQQNQCLPELFTCLGPVQFLCDSYCESVECGDDWCGGSCGDCGDGGVCQQGGVCQCGCEEMTCESQGFECGAFVCDGATCNADSSGCGSLNDPWTDWNVNGSGLNGGQVVSDVIPVIGEHTGAVGNNGAASSSWSVIRVGDAGMVGSPPFELLEVGVLTFDISGIPEGAVIESALLRMYQTKVVGELPFEADNYAQVGVQHIRFEGFWWDAVVNAVPVEATGTGNYPVVLSTDPTVGWKNVEIAAALRYELATCQEQLQLRLVWLPGEVGDGTQQSNQVHFNSDDAKDNNPGLTVNYRIGGTPAAETDVQTGGAGAN